MLHGELLLSPEAVHVDALANPILIWNLFQFCGGTAAVEHLPNLIYQLSF